MFSDKFKDLEFKPAVIAEQVSNILAEAILEGVFSGGDQLIEAELQKQFGISRSPLREAFRDLEKKGLVLIMPRKGTFVKRVTREDIEENFPVRAALEALAAREAHSQMTAKDYEEMEHTLTNMEKAVKENNTKAYWQQHLFFHDIFISASGNQVLIDILRTLRMHSLWYRFAFQYYQEDLHKNLLIHKQIYKLFSDRKSDLPALERLVKDHIEIAYEKFLSYLEQQASG